MLPAGALHQLPEHHEVRNSKHSSAAEESFGHLLKKPTILCPHEGTLGLAG